MLALLGLAAATLVSEDGACLTAALLIANGAVSPVAAIMACTAGIFVGDVALWALGRSGAVCTSRWAWVQRRLERARAHEASQTIVRRAAGAIVASRFLPGTRLPLYVAAGAMGVPFRTFAGWSLLACCLWTPGIILTAGHLSRAATFLGRESGAGVLALQAAGAFLTVPLVGLVRIAGDSGAWRRGLATLQRWQRWEFWPMWIFYLPVGLWILWLTVRHRGVTTMTAANPGLADGGTVGESKSDILAALPPDAIIPSFRLDPAADLEHRCRQARLEVIRRDWRLPIVMKPDVGQRGTGVRLIRTWEDVRGYLKATIGAVLVQPYDPGPFEAGVFYVRRPEWASGRIFSVTDKVFPEVAGDGRSSLEALIWSHPRFRLQASTFLKRLGERSQLVPAAGQRVRLALAGNHAQGTLFRDGRFLITPALERRIDEIARQVPGFFIGRFDIRYRSVEEFKQGTAFAIVELNGATAESTNIYDPERSLFAAYQTLFAQWSLVFSIGAENRRRGASVTPFTRLVRLVREHLKARPVLALSD